jgi:hypothetical protein
MNGSNARTRPDVVAIYYPHWHNYDHGSAWKGEGWTEWEGLRAAVPRFPGHRQPLKPVWGCFDESDPPWAEREIDLAADHGIDVFMYDWYWYSGVRNMEEALEDGFLKARNRKRLKFCLMWANHDRVDQFCPEYRKPRTTWLGSHHSKEDLRRVIDYCIEHYFREPNYWQVDGRLFFSIYQPVRFVDELGGPAATRALLDDIDTVLADTGLPPMHWSAMTSRPSEVPLLREAGFRSTGRYNINAARPQRAPDFEDYEEIMQAHRDHWDRMAGTDLPNMPVVTMGWDPTPRCRPDVSWPFPEQEYPYVSIIAGNTPQRFERLLRDAAEFTAAAPEAAPAVTIYCWNEWTEGGYLLPEEATGTAYLEAVRAAFPPRTAPED